MLNRLVMLGFALALAFAPSGARADDKLVHLHAPPSLVETGLMQHILPRFTLKTRVRVELVGDPASADMVLGGSGQALFEGAGQMWRMTLNSPGHAATERFAAWLRSDVGRRTVTAFTPEGVPLFSAPRVVERDGAVTQFDGDAALGRRVSRAKCIRCHAVDDESRMTDIGSTPSFSVLRSLPDWEARFSAFFTLNPHPAFTVIVGVTPEFPPERPSPIAPVTLTPEELDATIAYVAAMEPADLGAPLAHQ